MSSNQRSKMKPVVLDTWSVRERLALASSVLRSGDQNWVSVSRSIRPLGEASRPPEWFSQKQCARQYSALLEKIQTPKRIKRGHDRGEMGETPGLQIVRKLTVERVEELRRLVLECQQQYKKLKQDVDAVVSGQLDDQLPLMYQQLLQESKAEEALSSEQGTPVEEDASTPVLLGGGSEIAKMSVAIPLSHSEAEDSTQDSLPDSAGTQDNVNVETTEDENSEVASSSSPPLAITEALPSQSETLSQECAEEAPAAAVAADVIIISETTSSLAPVQPPPVLTTPTATPTKVPSSSPHAKRSQLTVSIPSAGVSPTHAVQISPKATLTASSCTSFMTPDTKGVPTSPVLSSLLKSKQYSAAELHLVKAEAEQQEPVFLSEPGTSLPVAGPSEPDSSLPDVSSTTPVSVSSTMITRVPATNLSKLLISSSASMSPHTQTLSTTMLTTSTPKTPEKHVKKDGSDGNESPRIKKDLRSSLSVPTTPTSAQLSPVKLETPLVSPVVSPSVTSPTKGSLSMHTRSSTTPKRDLGEELDSVAKPASTADNDEDMLPKAENVPPDKLELSQASSELLDESFLSETDHINSTYISVDDEIFIKEEQPLSPSSSVSSRLSEPLTGSRQSKKNRAHILSGRKAYKYHRKTTAADDQGAYASSKASEADTSDDDDAATEAYHPLAPHWTMLDSIPNSPTSLSQCSDTEDERTYKLWKKSIMLVWRAAATHKYANVFAHPVTEDIAPGYKSIVFRPMDLLTIKKSIENGVIRTTAEFQRDIMLMFTNAIMYNGSDHDVYHMATDMYNEVMAHIEQYVNTQLMVQTNETKMLRTSRRSDLSDKEDDVKKRRASTDQETESKAKKRKP